MVNLATTIVQVTEIHDMVKSLLNMHKPNSTIAIQSHELTKGYDAKYEK